MKIICIGRNYAAHARELNNEVPSVPVIFLKPKTAILLPGKPLYYPEFTDDLHYECEVVVKISKNGKFVSKKFARQYYNEISLGLDFTARDVQQKQKNAGLPWEIAKAFDGSAAVGDFITLEDDADLKNIQFHLLKNGEKVQDGNTKNMLFSIDEMIEYVSKFFTLNIGDLLFTGTPEGVGPLAINDKLEAFLDGKKLLSVDIK